MTDNFELDKATRPARAAPGHFLGTLPEEWTIDGRIVAGGYLLALMSDASKRGESAVREPVVISTHFLGACVPGDVEICVRQQKGGNSLTTELVEISQGGDLKAAALIALGNHEHLARVASPYDRQFVRGPSIGRVSREPLRHFDREMGASPLLERVHLFPEEDRDVVNAMANEAELQVVAKMADGRPIDALALALLADALPPTTIGLGLGGWSPTIQISVHIRRAPTGNPVVIHHRSRMVAGGLTDTDCEIWDSDGSLVATSRQLAMLPRG